MCKRFVVQTRFDKLMAELGIGHGQFEFEASRFDQSPRGWLEGRLRELGWRRVPVVDGEVEMKCERECCK